MWLALLVACAREADDSAATVGPDRLDLPPDALLGERLFRETRFAWYYAQNAGTDLNAPLADGDPAFDAPLPDDSAHPWQGQTMACRTCHMLSEGPAARAYNDAEGRSILTDRGDEPRTVRNTPALVEVTTPRELPLLIHWDGEFASGEGLARGAYTGRNMGWRADEGGDAAAWIARILRADDGSFGVASAYDGLSYAAQLAGGPEVDDALRVSRSVDVGAATDAELMDAVAWATAAYLDALVYLRSEDGAHAGSPYDRFLVANDLPTAPGAGESALDYSRRLRAGLTDAQPTAEFGEDALRGLEVFLTEPTALPPSGVELAAGGVGNCVACHPAPGFTDYGLHNTAVSEATYDRIHGPDAFFYLSFPTLAERQADPAAYLPASGGLPDGTGRYRAYPESSDPGLMDLGAWNILFHPDKPDPQEAIRAHIASAYGLADPTDEELLAHSVGLFKTPALRNLRLSQPYFHDGSADTLEVVLRFYRGWAPVARDGFTLNTDPQLLGVAIVDGDVDPLIAFLEALGEPYP